MRTLSFDRAAFHGPWVSFEEMGGGGGAEIPTQRKKGNAGGGGGMGGLKGPEETTRPDCT